MSNKLIIGVVATAMAAMVSSVAWAGSPRVDRWASQKSELLPAPYIFNSLLAVGLAPNGEAVQRGPYYVLHAIDPWGGTVRVVADARFGDIVSVLPVYTWTDYARYGRTVRIIHVPEDIYGKDNATPSPR